MELDAALSEYGVTRKTLHTLRGDTLTHLLYKLLFSPKPIHLLESTSALLDAGLEAAEDLLWDDDISKAIRRSAARVFYAINVFHAHACELREWFHELQELVSNRDYIRRLEVTVDTENKPLITDNKPAEYEYLSALFQPMNNLASLKIKLWRQCLQYDILETFPEMRFVAPAILQLKQTKPSTKINVEILNFHGCDYRSGRVSQSARNINDCFDSPTEEDKRAVEAENYTKAQYYRVMIPQWAELDREKLLRLGAV